MELSFTLEHTNLLIILIALVIIFYLLSKKFSKKRALRFGNFETLQKVAGKKLLSYSIVPVTIRILALIFIILGLSNPILTVSVPSSDTDYVFAIDTSSSMLTPDVLPNRLEATRFAVLDFVNYYNTGYLGIVTFSGEAHIKTELTRDKEKLIEIIKNIDIDKSAGTAIGEALVTSSIVLSESKNNRTILLITDGRNNRGIEVNKTYSFLKEKKIKVISIGLGNKTNETIQIPKELEGLNATAAEFPYLDEAALKEISNEIGGTYYKVAELSEFKNAIKTSIHQELLTMDLQFYLLILACIILLLEWGLELTKYRVIP